MEGGGNRQVRGQGWRGGGREKDTIASTIGADGERNSPGSVGEQRRVTSEHPSSAGGAARQAEPRRQSPAGRGGQPRRGSLYSDSASGRSTLLMRIGSFTERTPFPLFNYIINVIKGWIRVPLVQCLLPLKISRAGQLPTPKRILASANACECCLRSMPSLSDHGICAGRRGTFTRGKFI